MRRSESPLLDVAGAAAYLATTERHIRSMVYMRTIPFVKVGRLLRFKVVDLDAWIEANRTDGL